MVYLWCHKTKIGNHNSCHLQYSANRLASKNVSEITFLWRVGCKTLTHSCKQNIYVIMHKFLIEQSFWSDAYFQQLTNFSIIKSHSLKIIVCAKRRYYFMWSVFIITSRITDNVVVDYGILQNSGNGRPWHKNTVWYNWMCVSICMRAIL